MRGRSKHIGDIARKHGHASPGAETPTYLSWTSMLRRTRHRAEYSGVPVSERWFEFASFLLDMGERPEGTALDRIDNSKGYEPGNCRWATPKEQANNKRNNVVLSYRGRQQTVAQWAREQGLSYHTLSRRIGKLGWSVERSLSTPVSIRGRSGA